MTTPAEPINVRALEAIIEKLRQITPVNGYLTRPCVHLAKSTFDKAELPAISVFEGDETHEAAGYNLKVELEVNVHGFVLADREDTGLVLGRIKADIKQAIGKDDVLEDAHGKIGKIASGGAKAEPRPDGSQSESVTVTFVVRYQEGIGNPYTAI